ncbi:MAG: hypothetical protein IVW56_11350 [Candidatus Binataceae bacterium]|nr:hypothetical protein [Candidatus Binataceae bacterium]
MNINAELKVGATFWLPCKVRRGPFPNERRVYIKTDTSDWFGFVSTSELKDKREEGNDYVRALVLTVKTDSVIVQIRGQSPASGPIQAKSSMVAEYAFIPA